MKILKILGIVASVHVAAVLLLFATQGCRSTAKSESASGATTSPPTPASTAAPSDASAPQPAGATDQSATTNVTPTITFSVPGSDNGSGALYSPTRPGTPAATAIESSTPITGVTPVATYTVAKGDSLWKIAEKNHMSVSTLAKTNNLKPGSPLQIGQKLIIPGTPVGAPERFSGPTYKVKSGDTLKVIAKRTGTTTTALRSLNHLKNDSVRVGQELKLPPGAVSAPETTETSTAPSAAATSETKTSGGMVKHVVKPGEKLATIAKKYGVSVGELATANNISDPGKIRAGQELVIPGWTAPGGKPAKSTAPAATTTPPPQVPAEEIGPAATSGTEPPVIKVEETPPAPAASSNTSASQP